MLEIKRQMTAFEDTMIVHLKKEENQLEKLIRLS